MRLARHTLSGRQCDTARARRARRGRGTATVLFGLVHVLTWLRQNNFCTAVGHNKSAHGKCELARRVDKQVCLENQQNSSANSCPGSTFERMFLRIFTVCLLCDASGPWRRLMREQAVSFWVKSRKASRGNTSGTVIARAHAGSAGAVR